MGEHYDGEPVRRIVGELGLFLAAFDAWLETQVVRENPRRTGKRPVTTTRPDADPHEVARLADAVRVHQDLAAVGVRLGAVGVPGDGPPDLNAVEEWEGMSRVGATVNPSDVRNNVDRARVLLEMILERAQRGLPLFPVPDARLLHPYTWVGMPAVTWVQEKYSRLPSTLARSVGSAWASRLAHPRFPPGVGLWEGLLSPEPPTERQPRLRVPDLGDADTTAAHQHALAAALEGLEALSLTYSGTPGAPTVPLERVGGWFESWSTLCWLLEECTIAPAPQPPTPTAAAHPPAPTAPPAARDGRPGTVTVDPSVFAPIPVPGMTDVFDGAHEIVVVDTENPREDLARALAAAAHRLQLVDSDGTEHPDHDTLAEDAGDLHTPSWVAVLTDDHDHPYLYADCQGVITQDMGATMRRILTEELTRALTTAHARTPDP